MVVSTAKKILIVLTEKVVNKEVFLKNIKLVVSENLYEEIIIIVKAEEINKSKTKNLTNSYDISKMVQDKRTEIKETYKNYFLKKDIHENLKEVDNNLEVDPDEIIQDEYSFLTLEIFLLIISKYLKK